MLLVDPAAQTVSARLVLGPADRGKRLALMRPSSAAPETPERALRACWRPALMRDCTEALPSGDELYDGLGNKEFSLARSRRGMAQPRRPAQRAFGRVVLDPRVPLAAQACVWLDVASHVGIAVLAASVWSKPI